MTEANKDTIYIDIDDEITGIIDKVSSSKKKIVALVLPKRAAVMQSIVNMKLLKHSAKEVDKKIVLITSEAGLLPLAGSVGLHVAKTLQSKPEIPPGPDGAEPMDDSDITLEDEPDIDQDKSVGELSGGVAVKSELEETIDLDNSQPAEDEPKTKTKSKKPKVPNFDSFRKKLFLGFGGLLLIIFLWVFATSSLPKVSILIKTDTQTQDTNPSITVDTDAKDVDTENLTTPGTFDEIKKTDTQTAPATGQKDIGDKASGQLTANDCSSVSGTTIGKGARFTSSSGKVFTNDSQFTTTLANVGGSLCWTSTFDVTATKGGKSYNIAPTSYTNSLLADYDISGGQMSGGTSEIVKVISQADIDSAKDKLADDSDEAKEELQKALEEAGLVAMVDTFTPGKASVKATPAVDKEGDTVNLSSTTAYSMLGVKRENLQKLIDESLKSDIDTNNQAIQDYGFDKAKFSVTSKKGKQYSVSVQATVTIGPKLDIDDIKRRVAGKKRGDIQNDIGSVPGVKEVIVDYSPFWVAKAPNKPAKISVIIESANGTNEQQTP